MKKKRVLYSSLIILVILGTIIGFFAYENNVKSIKSNYKDNLITNLNSKNFDKK